MDLFPPDWFLFVAPVWIAMVVLASILYRHHLGKPIHPRLPSNAVFAERGASAPFASRCLLVSVTETELAFVPQFPFNLMFLPEIYRLERTIPLAAIKQVDTPKRLLGCNVVVTYGDRRRVLRLRLREPLAFIEALRLPR